MPLKYQLKFYANTPSGKRNKLFAYGVHNGQHACNLLARFVARGFKLRSSFLGRPGTRGDRIPKIIEQFPASIASAGRLLIAYPG